MFLRKSVVATLALLLVAPCSALADSYANSGQSIRAKGHYARARALLIEALSEFEEAESIASPDLLIDSEKWKLSVVSRTEELNRVLDPKPRVTRDGVRFKADNIYLKHEKTRAPRPKSEPYSVNYAGEDARKAAISAAKRAKAAKAKQEAIKPPTKKRIKEVKKLSPNKTETARKSALKTFEDRKPVTEVTEPIEEVTPKKVKVEKVAKEEASKKAARASLKQPDLKKKEDPEVSKAIEAVIRERLKQLEKE